MSTFSFPRTLLATRRKSSSFPRSAGRVRVQFIYPSAVAILVSSMRELESLNVRLRPAWPCLQRRSRIGCAHAAQVGACLYKDSTICAAGGSRSIRFRSGRPKPSH